MAAKYQEVGGLRWGISFWRAANATWPFASLQASSEMISVTLSVFGLYKRQFEFSKAEIIGVRKKRGIFPFNTGIIFTHRKPEYPPFILFWSFSYQRLSNGLARLGFLVAEDDA